MRKKTNDTAADVVVENNYEAVSLQIEMVESAVNNVLVIEKIVSLLPNGEMKDIVEEDLERAKRVLKSELDTYVMYREDYICSLSYESELNTTKEWKNCFPTNLGLLKQIVEKILNKS